jgi:hypothetical protein
MRGDINIGDNVFIGIKPEDIKVSKQVDENIVKKRTAM